MTEISQEAVQVIVDRLTEKTPVPGYQYGYADMLVRDVQPIIQAQVLAGVKEMREKAQAVVDAQRSLINAVTPKHPDWVNADKEPDRYSALFSRWHSTTRELARALATLNPNEGPVNTEDQFVEDEADA